MGAPPAGYPYAIKYSVSKSSNGVTGSPTGFHHDEWAVWHVKDWWDASGIEAAVSDDGAYLLPGSLKPLNDTGGGVWGDGGSLSTTLSGITMAFDPGSTALFDTSNKWLYTPVELDYGMGSEEEPTLLMVYAGAGTAMVFMMLLSVLMSMKRSLSFLRWW